MVPDGTVGPSQVVPPTTVPSCRGIGVGGHV